MDNIIVTTAGPIVDTTPPTTTISLSGTPGNQGWYTSNVAVSLSATDDWSGVAKTEYSFDNLTWITYATSFTATNEGTTIVYYRSTDTASNVEAVKTQTVKIDKAVPTGSIVINGGAASTTSLSVTLTLTSTDPFSGVSQVRYSNDGVWDTEQWETPSSTKTWALTAGNEVKTVHFQIKDNAGLISVTYQDSITLELDTIKPVANAGQNQTVSAGETVSFDGGASSDNVGIVSYEWDCGDGTTDSGKTITHTYYSPGNYTVKLTVKDSQATAQRIQLGSQ